MASEVRVANEVRAARALYRSSLSNFPPVPGTKTCNFPVTIVPGSVLELHGTCETRISPGRPDSSKVIISFTERWPGYQPDAAPRMPAARHTWQVYETPGAKPKILAANSIGAPPP